MLKRFAAALSCLWEGIDPAGLGVQITLTLVALGGAGWMITARAASEWVAGAAFILGNTLGARLHLGWARAERPLPRWAAKTFLVRSEALTVIVCAGIIEGLRALPVPLAPELTAALASARLAFGIAAAFVATHTLVAAPGWLADRSLADDPEARVRVPQRPPRLRLRVRSTPPDA